MRRLIGLAALALCVPGAAAAKCEVGVIGRFAVTMDGAAPHVDAKINGVTKSFLLDSGAFFSSITTATATELGLYLSHPPEGLVVVGIGGASNSTMVTRVKKLGIAGAEVPFVDFLVMGSEVGAAGLIGQNVLGIADVEYDLGHGDIHLFRETGCHGANFAYWAGTKPVSEIEIEPRDRDQPFTIGSVYLNGVKMRAMFDSGSDVTVVSLAAAARAGIKPTSPGVEVSGASTGNGTREMRTWTAPFASFKIAGEEIKRVKLQIGNLRDMGTDMLVGADFFLSHHILVSNVQRRMIFTYEGGPIFDHDVRRVVGQDVAARPSADFEPKDADGFARRAAAAVARKQFAAAIPDYDRAIALDGKQARFFAGRADAEAGTKTPDKALADLDAAIDLNPGDPVTRLSRADLRLDKHDKPGAREDVEAADRLATPQADLRLSLAGFFSSLDLRDHSISQYDLWLRYHPDNSGRASALNGRCWNRAILNRDLDAALADCNAALRLRPHSSDILDSRGLVKLRRGDLAEAIADYDAALASEPKAAWTLYARGIAKEKLGRKVEAEADLAASKAINSDMADRAQKWGLVS